VLTAYILSGGVATPIAGRLGDMYGKRRTLVWLLAVVAAGTLLCAVSTSLVPMIVGRLISGVAAGLFPLAYGVIRDEFPAHRVATAIGVISVSVGIGTGVAVVLAGFLLGIQICATIVARQTGPGGLPGESGFATAFWVCAAALAGASVVAALVPGRQHAPVRQAVGVADCARPVSEET
jgi:MFS family permease